MRLYVARVLCIEHYIHFENILPWVLIFFKITLHDNKERLARKVLLGTFLSLFPDTSLLLPN